MTNAGATNAGVTGAGVTDAGATGASATGTGVITVEPMRWWHLEQVVAMEAELFATDSPWSAEMFWSELAAEHHYVVATVAASTHAGTAAGTGTPASTNPASSAGHRGAGGGSADHGSADHRTVVGYAGLAVLGSAPHDDSAEVRTIGVADALRGRGLGRRLLRNLLAAAGSRAVLLEVRTDNDAAISLYRSEGFELLHRRRRYYQPSGADAYTMLRPAGGSAGGPGTPDAPSSQAETKHRETKHRETKYSKESAR